MQWDLSFLKRALLRFCFLWFCPRKLRHRISLAETDRHTASFFKRLKKRPWPGWYRLFSQLTLICPNHKYHGWCGPIILQHFQKFWCFSRCKHLLFSIGTIGNDILDFVKVICSLSNIHCRTNYHPENECKCSPCFSWSRASCCEEGVSPNHS